MALTTKNDVKNQAGINLLDVTKDAMITAMIGGVTDIVYQTLGRCLEATLHTEYYNGDGRPMLLLRQYPVISVTTVCVDQVGYAGQNPDDAFDPSLNLVDGVDYMVMPGLHGVGSSGMLRRLGEGRGWWSLPSRPMGALANQAPVPRGNIKVVYTAGFEQVPPAIKMAVNEIVIQKVNNAPNGGYTSSESYQGASASFVQPDQLKDIIGSINQVLKKYKSVVI